MQHNFDLQLQETAMTEKKSGSSLNSGEHTREWISAFNTAILTTRTTEVRDGSPELSKLMQTPEFASLMIAAQHLSDAHGISKEESTERLVDAFRKIDQAWTQIVMRRGLQSMLD
jgi:hypothetical protein